MKSFYLFVFIVFSFNLSAQVNSSCDVPDALQEYYDLDVKKMAVRRMYETHHADTSLIQIGQLWQDTIMDGLAAILQSNIPESDSVFNAYCIHNVFGGGAYYSIVLSVDTSYNWVQSWSQFDMETDNQEVNAMMAAHGLWVSDFNSYPWGSNIAVVSSNTAFNPVPLNLFFETIPGVNYSETNYYFGDGNIISYTKDAAGIRYYDFEFGYGDCLVGCMFNRVFHFQVNPNCSVELLGVDHNGPDPQNLLPFCNSFVGISEFDYLRNFAVYPNPSDGSFTLKNDSNFSFSIYDCLGRKVVDMKDQSQSVFDLNLPNLKSGVYTIFLHNDQKFLGTKQVIIQ